MALIVVRPSPTMRARWPYLLCVAAALAVAVAYAWKTLAVGPRLGFPLDDAYIYMTYAKQAARGRPFTYFDGGGYSAGATSVLWPLLTAPLWALGLRGHLFVWGIFAVSAGLLAASACLVMALARRVFGAAHGTVGGALAATLVVGSGTLTWGYLSGMEIALCGTLLLAVGLRLADEPLDRPSRTLLVLLAGAALARPEASLLVAALVAVHGARALWRRDLAGALRWAAPLAPLVVLALANRVFAGHFTPNTALVKSAVYLPGFSPAYLGRIVKEEGYALFDALFWSGLGEKGPTWAPKLTLALYLGGGARLIVWGARQRRLSAALFLFLAPLTIWMAVLTLTGAWKFHNYRYIATGLPVLLGICGLALAPSPRPRIPTPLLVAIGVFVSAATFQGTRVTLARDVLNYAGEARDLQSQLVEVAAYVRDHVPAGATVAVHDVGIMGYFSEHPLLDVIGLITNGTAEVCNHGPGARFEAFERMRPEERPAYFVYYPGWLLTGSTDLFGEVLFAGGLPPQLGTTRLVGGSWMTVMAARWDLLGSGAAPLSAADGWEVVDEVDVADLVSEQQHRWRGRLVERKVDTRTAAWSQYFSVDIGARKVADGGRTILPRDGERFMVTADPDRPLRLVIRTGGPASMAASSLGAAPATLVVTLAGGAELGRLALPAPTPTFAETTLELPADPARPRSLDLHIVPTRPYRVFHWYVLSGPTGAPPR